MSETTPPSTLHTPPSETVDDQFFANRKEALSWLRAQGYKVGQFKFYTDIKENGFPVLTDDGRVSRYQVQVYGENLKAAKQAAKTTASVSRSDDLARREKADADVAEMKAERMRREESEYWMAAADAWSAIAGLMGELRRAVRRELHENQNRLVEAAGGDVVRAPELFEETDRLVDRAFNEVAAGGLDIRWREE